MLIIRGQGMTKKFMLEHNQIKSYFYSALKQYAKDTALPPFDESSFIRQSQFNLDEVASEVLHFGFDRWPTEFNNAQLGEVAPLSDVPDQRDKRDRPECLVW